jgi:hypothetical protein
MVAGHPNLYAAVLSVRAGGQAVDRRLERFGWRQFTLAGREVRLNGRPIRLSGDLLHPFGPLVMSRRHTWAWYRFVRDFGGNAVRPHAQPHPRHTLDLADEMGLVVLDETAIFGSSIALNFEAPVAWERFAEHIDGLVRRDRKPPVRRRLELRQRAVCDLEHNRVSTEAADDGYSRLTTLGRRAFALDPTRGWISCDGDEDLRGTLPVWSKHFGHGTPLDRLPDRDKPLMVGESGGTYYARPRQMAEFNGPRAYESYAGRNEALAIDVYDNIVRMARPKLAWYSASETAWFGAEPLGLGWRDRARVPGPNDGVFFAKPFEEGRARDAAGPPAAVRHDAQSRLGPGVAALQAARHVRSAEGRACAGRAGTVPVGSEAAARRPRVPPRRRRPSTRVGFAGDTNGVVARRLRGAGRAAGGRGLRGGPGDCRRGFAGRSGHGAGEGCSGRRGVGGGAALVLLGGASVPDDLLPAAGARHGAPRGDAGADADHPRGPRRFAMAGPLLCRGWSRAVHPAARH